MDRRERMANRREQREREADGGGPSRYVFLDQGKMKELDIEWMKLAANKEYLLVPIAHSEDEVGYEVNIHYAIGSNGINFACPRPPRNSEADAYGNDFKGACPVCEKFDKLQARQKAEGVEFGDKEAWKEIQPYSCNRKKPHHVFFAYDLNEMLVKGMDVADMKLKVLVLPEAVAGPSGKIVAACYDPRSKDCTIDPMDPHNGRDIFIKTGEQGEWISYDDVRFVDRSDADGIIDYGKEYPEWYAKVPRHKDVIRENTYAEIKEALDGYAADPEEEKPVEGSTRRRRRQNDDTTEGDKDDTPKDRLDEVRREKEQEDAAKADEPEEDEPVRRRRRS